MYKHFLLGLLFILFITGCSKVNEPEITAFKNNEDDGNYYLVSQNGKGVLIDAGGCLDEISQYADTNKIKVEAIILTHRHSDHTKDAAGLKEKLGSEIMISKRETDSNGGLYPIKADVYLDGDQKLNISGMPFEVINTPGHTPGSISIILGNIIFTGDTLFWNTIGSVHFGGGNYDEMVSSIRGKLLTLDDDTIVYPGHGPATSIGDEIANNVYLK